MFHLRFFPPRYAALRAIRNVTMAWALTIFPAFAAPVTVLALGDSLTQGYGLAPEDGFVPQLQAWLAAQGKEVTVINAGVSGDTTAGGLSRVDWSLTPEVQAMIVNLGGNDLLRGIDPATSRANLAGILDKAKARNLPVLLVSLTAPENYGPDFKSAFDAIYPDLATRYGALLGDNYFAPLIDRQNARLAPDLMQADGIHPNAEGVKKAVAALGPRVLDLLAQIPPPG
jgi:acyl-CoA thioesterase-1